MSIEQDPELLDEEEYDEEADSDFQADNVNEEDVSASSDEEAKDSAARESKKQKKTTDVVVEDEPAIELDSGDEATIKEQKKAKRKQKKKGEYVDADSDNETGWRAKTRAMREQEKDEKKRRKLANIDGSTIDVDKIWEEMNRSGPLPPVRMEGIETTQLASSQEHVMDTEQDKENITAPVNEEMVTIKRKFKFAGEVHVEEKVVPKSSAEAQLWLAQQEGKSQHVEEGGLTRRPLRKTSRFDPNYNNLDAFKMNWLRTSGAPEAFKGPKLNVVEKSKIDWASHVDTEGLKDELTKYATSKESYHGRMEFLDAGAQRREEEARQIRMKR